MVALSRELGSRGRADAQVSAGPPDGPEPAPPSRTAAEPRAPEPDSQLKRELERLKLGALSRRAADIGVDEEALDAAEDTDDPKGAIIQLILVEHALLTV